MSAEWKDVDGEKKEENEKLQQKNKNMKLQPYIDFWVSETDGLLLPSMCIVMVSYLSLCVSLHPLSPSFFLRLSAAKVTKAGSHSLFLCIPSPPFLPPPTLTPSLRPPYAMFSIFWECQCATCWHCAWMITCLYIVIENRIPFPWCWQQKWSECCTDSGFQFVRSLTFSVAFRRA